MRKLLLISTALLLCLSLLTTVQAATPEEKGLEIARKADERDRGFGDSTAKLLMTLKNRHGQESVRQIRVNTLEVDGDGDKSLSIFDNPRDVKGTAFLTYSHKEGDDDQWLYLPALKRVKRISSRNKSGSFMGSEFSYEDIASQEVEKYMYKWVRDEVLDGKDCHVVELYPVDKHNSGYSKQVTWMDKKEYRVWKVEYFDRKGAHLKTLNISGYKKHMEKFWRASNMHIINHQNGKSTVLEFSGYKFGNGLNDKDFSQNSLKRAR